MLGRFLGKVVAAPIRIANVPVRAAAAVVEELDEVAGVVESIARETEEAVEEVVSDPR